MTNKIGEYVMADSKKVPKRAVGFVVFEKFQEFVSALNFCYFKHLDFLEDYLERSVVFFENESLLQFANYTSNQGYKYKVINITPVGQTLSFFRPCLLVHIHY